MNINDTETQKIATAWHKTDSPHFLLQCILIMVTKEEVAQTMISKHMIKSDKGHMLQNFLHQ